MILAAAGFAAAAALVWAVAFGTARGVRLDAHALADFMDAGRHGAKYPAEVVVRLADPVPFALLSGAVLTVALVRRGVRVAAILGVVLFGACLTSQLLKQLTADPRGIELVPYAHVSPAAWPSGHTTAATALALCLVAVAPARLRPHAAVAGAALAFAVAISVLLLGWHFPSDVLGGVCVAAAWMLCGLAAAGLPAPDVGHLRRRDGEEEDVGVERQAGHVAHRLGGVARVHRRLGDDRAVGLQRAALDRGGDRRARVADVDLPARDVVARAPPARSPSSGRSPRAWSRCRRSRRAAGRARRSSRC